MSLPVNNYLFVENHVDQGLRACWDLSFDPQRGRNLFVVKGGLFAWLRRPKSAW